MHYPSLNDLPSPPPGRTGWPWIEETVSLPDTLPIEGPDKLNKPKRPDKTWPRISIVTPSYNHGQFIEETIRSVLLQGYPNLEYFIMDGGSKDNSVEIIRKYEPWLTYWVSEPDRGQSNALNKGFKLATGEIVGWLNSDDMYLPEALFNVATEFPEDRMVGAISGISVNIETMKPKLDYLQWNSAVTLESLFSANPIMQPGTFVRREMFKKVGYLREDLHFIMDHEFWIRVAMRCQILRIEKELSAVRWHPKSKSSSLSHLWLDETRTLLLELSHKPRLQNVSLQKAIREGLARWCAINGQISLREGKIIKGFLCYMYSLIYKPSKLFDIGRLLHVMRKFLFKVCALDR